MPSALRQYHDQRVLTPTLKEPIVDVSLYQKATARELSMKCTTLMLTLIPPILNLYEIAARGL